MSIAGNSNDSLTLYQAAQSYFHNGYGAIPVQTDPGRAKVAAVCWSQYQQQQPTRDELHHWFIEQGHTGLAIVTGAISRLIVLDFDDLELFDHFQRLCPDLAATRTIRTKRGVHLWFHTRVGQQVHSKAGQGIDLKADGGYVIAPPTVIDGHAYTCILDRPPLLLTSLALSRIQAFIAAQATLTADTDRKAQVGRFLCEIEVGAGSDSAAQTPVIPSSSLIRQYRVQALQGSRNEALFHISLRARDSGYAMQAVIDLLADYHAKQPPNHPHKPETYRQRQREASATIHSVYSRPPRPQNQQGRAAVEQLPNSVREALFQLKQTYTVRVIEGLRLAGIQPGQAFTTTQALKLLAGQVGKHSIYAALNTHSSSGEAIFNQQAPPLDTPEPLAHADKLLVTDQTKTCVLVGPKNREKGLHHRPARIFVMPDNHELCAKLGVKLTWSDPLTEQDLTSAKQTRLAAHRELIKRRPGLYPRHWLARRLGVDVETLDIYNRDIPIHVRHCFSEKPISWHNLEDIPLSLDIAGTFLEDETGKHYPAKREIARKLLARKHTLTYKRQDVNFYWYGETSHTEGNAALHMPSEKLPASEAFRSQFPQVVSAILVSATVRLTIRPEIISPASMEPIPQATAATVYRDRAAEERLAERVYRTVTRMSSAKTQWMSKANAHRLVETYGAAAVEQALKKLKWYAGKGRVTKPAGFLITASRLAWREVHGQTGAPAPRFRRVRRS